MRRPEPEIGTPVSLRMRKWDGSPHRQASMVYLGSDEYGGWLTNSDGSPFPTGTEIRNPGDSSVRRATHVMLVPHDGCYLAHFNSPPSRTSIYADITTAPEFGRGRTGWVIGVADMDLDVVRRVDGQNWIEDEDEFAAHTVGYGYPADVVATTRAAADTVLAAVRDESEPFGTTWRRWIDRLDAIAADTRERSPMPECSQGSPYRRRRSSGSR